MKSLSILFLGLLLAGTVFPQADKGVTEISKDRLLELTSVSELIDITSTDINVLSFEITFKIKRGKTSDLTILQSRTGEITPEMKKKFANVIPGDRIWIDNITYHEKEYTIVRNLSLLVK